MDLLSILPIGNLSAGLLLGLVVILIVRGDLVPRKVHEEVRADRDKWQATAEKAMNTNAELAMQSRLGVKVFSVIEEQATRTSGDPHAVSGPHEGPPYSGSSEGGPP